MSKQKEINEEELFDQILTEKFRKYLKQLVFEYFNLIRIMLRDWEKIVACLSFFLYLKARNEAREELKRMKKKTWWATYKSPDVRKRGKKDEPQN